MKITIQGKDYSASLDAIHPLTIERKLNEPSLCQFWLSLPSGGSLPTPSRNQSVAVTGDDGTQYFTGYIAASPAPVYAGMSIDGPFYRFAVQALSDEFLMDQLQLSPNQGAAGMTAGRTYHVPGPAHPIRLPQYSRCRSCGSRWQLRAGAGRIVEQVCRVRSGSGSRCLPCSRGRPPTIPDSLRRASTQ